MHVCVNVGVCSSVPAFAATDTHTLAHTVPVYINLERIRPLKFVSFVNRIFNI